ncbi:O-antigen ligase family protein [Planctomycetota bacterium]
MFGNRTGAWGWLIPIVMIVGARRSNWRLLTEAFALHITIGVFLGILFLVLFRAKATNFASWDAGMFYATSFFLLTWSYHTKTLKALSLLGFTLFFIGNLVIASRTNVAGCLCYIICFMVIYVSLYRQNRTRSTVHPFVLVLVGIIVIIIAYPALSSLQRFRTIQDRFERKLFDDTRSHIADDLFASQVGWERLIGKGALGTTWSSYFYSYRYEKGGDSPERLNIEPGYLQIIFKGGYVMLVLFLALTVPAGILGVFCSKNLLARACGLIILVNLGGMVVSWPPLIRPPYVLFWLSVGACLCKRIRMATDVELLGEEEFNEQIEYEAT